MNLLWYRCYRFGVVGWVGVIVVCLCVFCGMLILWCCCFAVVLGVVVGCGFDLVVSGDGLDGSVYWLFRARGVLFLGFGVCWLVVCLPCWVGILDGWWIS